MSATPTVLVRRLYRQLLRTSRLHDVQPQLKAHLQHPIHRVEIPASQLQTLLVKEVENLKERLEKKKKKKKKEDSSSTKEGEESPSSVSESLWTQAGKSIWRSGTSPLVQRVYDTIFRGKLLYWPQVTFTDVVKKEFRQAIQEEKTGVKIEKKKVTPEFEDDSIPSTTTTKSPTAASSHNSTASHLTDGFSLLRVLNKNSSEHLERFTREQMLIDPAFEFWYKRLCARLPAQFYPSLARFTTLRDAMAAESDEEIRKAVSQDVSTVLNQLTSTNECSQYLQWVDEGVMQPSSKLGVGSFIVAHPQMGKIWDQVVILILRHDEEEGTLGVILNRPQTNFRIAFDKLFLASSPALKDMVVPLPPFPTRHGGPVSTLNPVERVPGTFILTSEWSPSTVVFLHRLPSLAHVSVPVIKGTDSVWSINSKKSLNDAMPILFQLQKESTAANTSTTDQNSRLATPLLPSDLITYSGICTWTPGQLASELQDGSWVIMSGSGRHVFLEDFELKSKPNQPAEPVSTPTAAVVTSPSPATSSALSSPSSPTNLSSMTNSTQLSSPVTPIPHRSFTPISIHHSWNHAMFQLKGEHRAWARMKADEESRKRTQKEEE